MPEPEHVVAGALALVGLQHLLLPEHVWSLGFYPEGTPTHPMWVLTVRAFGVFLTGWSITLFDRKLLPEALVFNGAALLGVIGCSGLRTVAPFAIASANLLAGGWLFKHRK